MCIYIYICLYTHTYTDIPYAEGVHVVEEHVARLELCCLSCICCLCAYLLLFMLCWLLFRFVVFVCFVVYVARL